ncbi:MAG: hypothetical protein IKP96_02440 [Elusimicrobiaceae bacterium]|nr:hypothetical protein [Elusimicrobiaceae bacterium]
MKSIKNEAVVSCPNHCEEFEVEYWSLISADQDPDLKTAALGGELNLVQCPVCGAFFHHDGDFIYFDAPAELLVFVFAEKNRSNEVELRQRMQRDYETIKNTLEQQLHMDYPPVCVFGLEALKELLREEEKYSFESEAVAASAAAAGFHVVRLKPSYARANHFPYYVPAPEGNPSPNDYALAASKVLKSGLQSTLLLNFKDQMSQEGVSIPLVL